MQTELLNRKKWATVVELSVAMADYIENFHNTTRRHSTLDMLNPSEYETANTNILQLTEPRTKNRGHFMLTANEK